MTAKQNLTKWNFKAPYTIFNWVNLTEFRCIGIRKSAKEV